MTNKNTPLLAIDTASPICSVALNLIDKQVVLAKSTPNHQQSDTILPLIKQILKENNLQVSDLKGFSFAAGPGRFTGVRLAASVIQGLAVVNSAPVVKISSLQAMAQHIWRYQNDARQVLVLTPARRDDFYCAAFKLDSDNIMQPLIKEQVVNIKKLPWQELNKINSDWYILVDGLTNYKEKLEELARNNSVVLKWHDMQEDGLARDVATLAALALQSGVVQDTDSAMPIYLQNETMWEGRQ